MPASAAAPAPFPDDLRGRFPADELLVGLLETSLTGFVLYLPIRGADGTIVDFGVALLNAAAQQLLGLPARPAQTHRQLYPGTSQNGAFEFYRRVFESGQPAQHDFNCQHQGPDTCIRLSARRVGEGLVVSLAATAQAEGTAAAARQQLARSEARASSINAALATTNAELAVANAELQAANEEVRATNDTLFLAQVALHEFNQELEARVADRTARLQAAQSEAERERVRLDRFFRQAPAAICILDGPSLVYELVNPAYQALFPGRRLEGRPLLQALPELAHHPVWQSLQRVYRTGESLTESSVLIPVARHEGQPLEHLYFDYVQQARYNEHGQIDGVLVFAFEVTEQVLVKQRADALQAQALEAAGQLVRQRETLYQVFEQTPASVAILRGPEHRFEYLNPGYQALFRGRELLGKPLAEALPETVEFGFIALLDQVYRTGEPFFGVEMPLQLRDAAGAQLPEAYYTFTYQAYQEAGANAGVSIFAFAVTEQVLARRHTEALQAQALEAAGQLVRQRETLRQVFEQTPALVFIARGPEHRIDYVNPAYQALFPDRELVGRPTAEAIPEAAGEGFIALLDRVYTTNIPYFGNEVPAGPPSADGAARPRYLNFTYQAYHENGATVGVSSFAFDVTEQVLARQQTAALQKEVQHRDVQLQDLFEQAPVAIAVLRGPELVVELANTGVCELWGHTRDEVLGRPLLDAMPELRGQGFETLLERVMATGVPYVAQESPAQLPRNGGYETVFLNFVYQPLRDAWGRITGVAAVATDVSEQVAARQRLALANADLQAANEAVSARNNELARTNQQLLRTNQDLDNFVYAASHDLKQPVNNLAGLFHEVRLVTAFTDPEEEATLVPMVDEALRQLSGTIDDLATVGQVQRLPEPPAETVALEEITQELLQTLQPQVQAARARVTTDFAARPTITYARANLRTILLNLLSNSLKYTDPGRPCRVHLSVWVQEGRPVLLVEDNGLGFDVQRHRGELFHLFRRFHDHTEGTGVGLYLVNRIVQSNGGRVEVESEVGEGTTFRVFL